MPNAEQNSLSEYDAKFADWWKQVQAILGNYDFTPDYFATLDPHGAFDSDLTPAEFVDTIPDEPNEPPDSYYEGLERGMLDHEIPCAQCGCKRKVIEVHPANMRSPDPTEWYTLECGHDVI